MQESKWILRSKTFWVNVVLTGLLVFFLSENDISQMVRIFENPEMVQILLLGPGAMNIFARYFTGSPVGVFMNSSAGRGMFDSRTFRTNMLMAIPIYIYIYQEYSAGNLGSLSQEALIVLAIIPIANIAIRLLFTKEKVTLLPGVLGKIL